MAAEGFQFRSLYPYNKDREEDIDLQPGDILTVAEASLASLGLKDGDHEHPERLGWMVGVNKRTQQMGDFPGTYVQYVGPVTMSPSPSQPRQQRPLPVTPRPQPVPAQQGKSHFYLYSTFGELVDEGILDCLPGCPIHYGIWTL